MDNYTIMSYLKDLATECIQMRDALGLETSDDERIALEESYKLIDIVEEQDES